MCFSSSFTGTLVGNSYDFANSWALHSQGKRCKRVQTPSNTCNISSDIAEKVGAAGYHSGFGPPLPEGSLPAHWQNITNASLNPRLYLKRSSLSKRLGFEVQEKPDLSF